MLDALRKSFSWLIDKPEFFFLISGLVFGLLFLFITPQFKVPDENGHFHRAVEIAGGYLKTPEPAGISKYDEILLKNNFYSNGLRDVINKLHFQSGYNPVMYLSSSLGVKFGFLFKNPDCMFYFARMANLFVWLALIFFAIKITPIFKWQFLFCALLPMSLFEGMSVSADSFSNSFMFLFFAFLFKLVCSKNEKLSGSEIAILTVFTIISSFLKGFMFWALPLILLVKDKRKWVYGIGLLLLSLCLTCSWVYGNYLPTHPDANPMAKYLILNHPLHFAKLCVYTVVYDLIFWMKNFIGILGYFSVKRFPCWFYIITSLVFLSPFVLIKEKYSFAKKQILYVSGVFLFYLLYLLVVEYICWVSSFKIVGIQGRYFYVVAPLLFVMLSPFSKKFGRSPESFPKFKAFLLGYILFMLTFGVILLKEIY